MISISALLLLFRLCISFVIVNTARILHRFGIAKSFDPVVFINEGTFWTPELTARAERMTRNVVGIASLRWEHIVCDASLEEIIDFSPNLLYFFTTLSFEQVLLVAFVALFSLVITYERNKVAFDETRLWLASYQRKFLRLFGIGAI